MAPRVLSTEQAKTRDPLGGLDGRLRNGRCAHHRDGAGRDPPRGPSRLVPLEATTAPHALIGRSEGVRQLTCVFRG